MSIPIWQRLANWLRKPLSSAYDDTYGGNWEPGYWETSSTSSGVSVSPDKSLGLSAYFACLRVVSEDVGKLPLNVFRRASRDSVEPAPDHPLADILKIRPNPEISAMTFRETLTHRGQGWGNGYAEIVRDGSAQGRVAALVPLHPSRTRPIKEDGRPLYYEYNERNGTRRKLPLLNVLHIRNIGDEVQGYSIARLAAEALGVGLAAQNFAGAYYGNGTVVGGILKFPKPLSPDGVRAARKSFEDQHRGSRNSHKPIVLFDGMEYDKASIPADEAQFLESRQFQVEDICRFCRVPPHKVQHLLRAHFNNVEHLSIEYVGDTLMPWLKRWEEECNYKLFRGTEFFCEHNTNALLRGDNASRSTFYKTLFEMGVFSPNDILRLENRNPIGDEGDRRFVSTNLQDLAGSVGNDDESEEPAENEPEEAFRNRDAEAIVFTDIAVRMVGIEDKVLGKTGISADEIRLAYESHYDRLCSAFAEPWRAFGGKADALKMVVLAYKAKRVAVCLSSGYTKADPMDLVSLLLLKLENDNV